MNRIGIHSDTKSKSSSHQMTPTFLSDDPVVLSIDSIDFRLARSRRDLIGAFELLQRRYCEAGLSSDRSAELRVMPYHLWSQTQVFVAVHRNKVIGSVSLTWDGNPAGIPMECTYGEVVERLRREGQTVGEVCSLTVDSPSGQSTGDIFGQLTRLMTFFSRRIGLNCLVAIVHPRHAKFYGRAMGFEAIGNLEVIRQVCGQPGIPILCKINDRSRFHPRWQPFYFEGNFSDAELDPTKLSPSDFDFFAQHLPREGFGNQAVA